MQDWGRNSEKVAQVSRRGVLASGLSAEELKADLMEEEEPQLVPTIATPTSWRRAQGGTPPASFAPG